MASFVKAGVKGWEIIADNLVRRGIPEPDAIRIAQNEFSNDPMKAYKLFRTDDQGGLYPLFVEADTQVPVGQWDDAVDSWSFADVNNNRRYVPALTGTQKTMTPEALEEAKGLGIFGDKVKSTNQKAVAYRPAWHAGELPFSTHLGGQFKGNKSGVDFRKPDTVWAEVDMANDIDYQSEANKGIRYNKEGKPNTKEADLQYMPHGGTYGYTTNPNMAGEWLLSGDMKVNRILPWEEVDEINARAGITDLPRLNEEGIAAYKAGEPITKEMTLWDPADSRFDVLKDKKLKGNFDKDLYERFKSGRLSELEKAKLLKLGAGPLVATSIANADVITAEQAKDMGMDFSTYTQYKQMMDYLQDDLGGAEDTLPPMSQGSIEAADLPFMQTGANALRSVEFPWGKPFEGTANAMDRWAYGEDADMLDKGMGLLEIGSLGGLGLIKKPAKYALGGILAALGL